MERTEGVKLILNEAFRGLETLSELGEILVRMEGSGAPAVKSWP